MRGLSATIGAAALLLSSAGATLAADPTSPGTSDLDRNISGCGMASTPEAKVEACTKAISSGQLNADNAARALSNRGNAYLALGQIDRAIADYTNAIKLAPSAVGYFNRGNAYLKKEDYANAESDYTACLKLDPNFVDAYLSRGVTFLNRGQYDRAIQDYNEALRLRPNYVVAIVKRGTAYFAKGDYAHAIQDYDEALRLEPGNAQAVDMKQRAEAAQKGQK